MKLRSNPFHCLLVTDGVGVGKTISAGYVVYHQAHIERKPTLLVCPPILVDKWKMEMSHRFDLEIRDATTNEGFELMFDELNSGVKWDIGPIYICSYSLLSRSDSLQVPSLGLVIYDEIHSVRNAETKSFINAKTISSNAKYKMGLSATPINNKIEDLASILSVLIPSLNVGNANELVNDIWESPLIDSFSSMATRFLKEEISEEFTKRSVHTEVIEYPEEYTILVNQLIENLMSQRGSTSFFERIIFYRLASSSPKAFFKSFNSNQEEIQFEDPKLNRLTKLLDSKKDERWLIFTEFKETAAYIEKSVDNRIILVLSGDKTREEREAIANIFRSEPNCIMVMTPVGSEGLDFQFCSNLVNYDLHWNPMKIEQRIGRIDRIGQEKDTIFIHNFVAKGGIDEKVLEVIGGKLGLVSDTFADIMPIIDATDNTNSIFDQGSLKDELKKADEMISAAKFYQRFVSSDLEVIDVINSEFCNTDNWVWLDWSTVVPWSTHCGKWVRENQIKLNSFIEIINAYKND
jgi:SNF2 family DNA or RNA helicase